MAADLVVVLHVGFERWIDAASASGLIRASDDQYRTLSLTPLGRDVMAGRVEDVTMAVPLVRHPSAPRRRAKRRSAVRREREHGSVGSAAAPRLNERAAETKPLEPVVATLRAWRLEEARRRAIAPFVILDDRTLTAIATSLPRSPAAWSRS